VALSITSNLPLSASNDIPEFTSTLPFQKYIKSIVFLLKLTSALPILSYVFDLAPFVSSNACSVPSNFTYSTSPLLKTQSTSVAFFCIDNIGL
jgi:hypothetical protein